MPITVPAHQAAILPFLRRFNATALVVGSCAPDFAYLLQGGWGDLSHVPKGLVLFCLPTGLVAYLWLELLVLPALRRALPRAGGVEWSRFAATPGLPRSLGGWLGVCFAIVLGAATHILWDGFSHGWMWPARALYPNLGQDGLSWLQRIFSVIGSAAVGIYAWRRYPSLPPQPAGEGRRLAWIALGTALGVAAALILRPEERVFRMVWTGVMGGLLGLSLVCAALRR